MKFVLKIVINVFGYNGFVCENKEIKIVRSIMFLDYNGVWVFYSEGFLIESIIRNISDFVKIYSFVVF